MPMFRASQKLIYYAHVPKCAGSAVESYLAQRFGPAAFLDHQHLSVPAGRRWTRTSPQHVDVHALGRLFPPGFFDETFTIVRHPVSRIVSAYHFQADVEKTVPAGVGFGDWLSELADWMAADPFVFDNHVRPMTDLVPDDATVFYLEHGLDALVPWSDRILGRRDGPRSLPHVNKRNEYARSGRERVVPAARELALIGDLYAADFARFGYQIDRDLPADPAPVVSPEDRAAAEAERRRQASLPGRFGRMVGRFVPRR